VVKSYSKLFCGGLKPSSGMAAGGCTLLLCFYPMKYHLGSGYLFAFVSDLLSKTEISNKEIVGSDIC
jgi:hypothetical protein